jgi:hypothetical protein
MQSSLIGKIEKAKRYAQETDRATFVNFAVNFQGEHNSYQVNYQGGQWQCSCHFFSEWQICSHVMAMQKILAEMLPPEAISSHLS